jgi:hypothetical protein
MKSSALALFAAPLAVQAHYIFSQVFVNGAAKGGDYAYIRKNTNSYMPSFTQDIVNSPDLRCNQGATPGSTQTLDVSAGDKIGFKLWFNEFIEHPGPGFVYMSKAPSDVASYDGSGDWFKVFESGLCGSNPSVDTDWCTWQKDRIEFTIPQNIPPGEYLVRVEHIGIHEGHVGKAQFYMECAQFKIDGPGGGTPGPLAKIPGIYSATDAGIAYNKWTPNPAPYVMPGPKVWEGGAAAEGSEPVVSPSGTAAPPSPPSGTAAPPSPPTGPAVPPPPSAPATPSAPGAPPAVPTSPPAVPSNPPTQPPGAPPGGGQGAPLYGQCGGVNHNGATTCAQGTCTEVNEYYSQCL